MKISNRQYAQALYEIISVAEEKTRKELIDNFMHLLKKHKKLSETDAILELFDEIEKEGKGVITASVTTAHSLTTEAKKIISAFVEKEYKASSITIEEEVDTAVIGGVKVKVKDTSYDTTLKTQLDTLKQQMSK